MSARLPGPVFISWANKRNVTQCSLPVTYNKERRSKIIRAISRHLFLSFPVLELFGRLRCIRTFNNRIALKQTNFESGGCISPDMDKWQIFVEKMKNFRVPWNSENSLTGPVTTDFSDGTLPHGVYYRKVKATFIGFVKTSSFRAEEWIFASPRRPARFGGPNTLPNGNLWSSNRRFMFLYIVISNK